MRKRGMMIKRGRFEVELKKNWYREKENICTQFCMTTRRTKQQDKVQGMQRGRRKGKGSRV